MQNYHFNAIPFQQWMDKLDNMKQQIEQEQTLNELPIIVEEWVNKKMNENSNHGSLGNGDINTDIMKSNNKGSVVSEKDSSGVETNPRPNSLGTEKIDSKNQPLDLNTVLQVVKENTGLISNEDRLMVTNIVLSHFTFSELKEMIAMTQDGMGVTEKEKIKTMVNDRLTPEDIEKLKSLAIKYMEQLPPETAQKLEAVVNVYDLNQKK